MKVRFDASRRVTRDPRKGLFRSKKIAFVLVIEWVFSFSELEKHVRKSNQSAINEIGKNSIDGPRLYEINA